MSNDKYTPGPWKWEDGHLEAGETTVAAPSSCGEVVIVSAEDARLIAAAPELLEALRRIADAEYRSDRRHRGMVDVEEVDRLQRTARAAIAKATGGGDV